MRLISPVGAVPDLLLGSPAGGGTGHARLVQAADSDVGRPVPGIAG